jgi:hypothetical protein
MRPMSTGLETLETEVERAADSVLSRLDQLVEEWLDEMWADPDYADWARPELREPARENARRDIGRELTALRDGRTLPTSCPEEVSASAAMAARNDFPLAGVLQSYRTGHAIQSRAWEEAVFDLELDPAQTRALLAAGSEFFFGYADRCSKWATRAYGEERERLLRGEEQRRTQLVRDILAGEDFDDDALGYELDAEHVAVIASGRSPERALDLLRAQLEMPLLRVAVDEATAWGWLGSPAWTANHRQLVRVAVPPTGTQLAIGGPAPGEEGFRRSHQEAEQAYRVAVHRPAPVTLHEDVALLALALQDEGRARAFVARELGPLAADDGRMADLRQTLRAYLGAGHQASSAAALLGVHERTVSNRIRAAEEKLARPITTRSTELDAALRLHELFEDG